MSKTRIALIVAVMIAGVALGVWFLNRDEPATRTVSGTIETDQSHIASRYGGRVERILAREGDSLEPGQAVVELDAGELKAKRDQAVAFLQELEKGPRKEEIEAGRADWESLQAQLEFAQAEESRIRELFQKKTVSETELDRATSQAAAQQKNAAAAKARYDLLLAGTRAERIDQARAQLAEIDAQLKEMRVAAPTNCILEVLSVKVGDVLPPNREVATLLLPHLWVRVYVPELWLGRIQPGQKVKVQVDSFPDREFEGEVEQINRQAEFTPRNVQTVEERVRQMFGVKVRLPGDETALRPGMSADVFFPNMPAPPKK